MNNSKTEKKEQGLQIIFQKDFALSAEEKENILQLLKRYLSEKLNATERATLQEQDFLSQRSMQIAEILSWEGVDLQDTEYSCSREELQALFKREQKRLLALVRNPQKATLSQLDDYFIGKIKFHLDEREKDPEKDLKHQLTNLSNSKAWRKVYQDNQLFVINLLSQKGAETQEAEEAWGESVFKLCEYYKKEGFYPDGKLKNFLFYIAKNYWIAQRRKNTKTEELDVIIEAKISKDNNIEPRIFELDSSKPDDKRVRAMQQCLEELKEGEEGKKRQKLENALNSIIDITTDEGTLNTFNKLKYQFKNSEITTKNLRNILKEELNKITRNSTPKNSEKLKTIHNYLNFATMYDIVNAFIGENKKHKEIQEEFGINSSSSKAKLKRGREKLMDCISQKTK